MDIVGIVLIVIAVIILVGLIALSERLYRKIWGGKIDLTKLQHRWQAAQKLCADKATWHRAIIDADQLLDDALKKRGFKGKTMGERLVAARDKFTDNDKVWYAHKLRNKLVHEEDVKLTEAMTKEALKGIRSALKDLRVL